MTTPARPPPSARSPFAGRGSELGALQRAIEAARHGDGSAVLVIGEAGIGKTRLVNEAVVRKRGSEMRVSWATAWEPGGAPAYWHWIQTLRALAAGRDRQALVRDLGADAEELSRLVPDLRAGVRLAAPGPPEGDDARFKMYDAVARFLRRASDREPLVIVLDDLHASDAGTLALLRFVVENGTGHLAIIGTTRDPRRDPVNRDVVVAVTELRRRMAPLPLGGLEPDDVAVILEAIVGAADAVRLTPEIHRRTSGNPLFVGELGQLLLADQGNDERLPESIRSVIERRLASLSDASLVVLRAAALIGERFAVDLVANAAGVSRGDVLEALDEATLTGIVSQPHPTPPTFAFSHALVREVLYEQLPMGARVAMHRRVGEALERLTDRDPPLAELAHHFLAGAAAVEDEKAADYAERAGRRAAEQLAYEDAANHFRAALAALELPGSNEERRIPLLLALGEATLRAGDLPAARDVFLQAAALARREGRADLLASAALGLGSGLDGFEIRLFDHTQITLLEEALRCLDQEPSALRSWATARLSVALTFAETQARRLQLAEEAAAMARRIDEPRALAYALAARCDATAGPEHIDERLDAATEIIRLAATAGDRGTELLGRRNRFIALLERGDIGNVDAELDSYEMVAAAIGQPLYQWYVPLWRGMRALMDGRLEASRAHGRDAAAIGARARSHNAALNTEVLEWNTLLKEGRWHEAGRVLAHQLELADGIYGESFWVPLIAPRAHPVEARAALDRLAAHHFDELPRDAVWLAAMTYAADACGVVAHAVAAEQLYDLVLPFRSRFAVDAIGAACYGSMSRPLGVLATVLGRRAEAEEHFDDAIAAHRRGGATALVAETLNDLGTALASFGEGTRAHAVLEEVRSLYRSLGMDHRSELVAEVAATVTAPPPPRAPNVFIREGDYWTLGYRGRIVRVVDAKGLRDIATLLARPGRELHVADLIAASDPSDDDGERARATLLRGGASPDPIVDPRARAAYRARLLELRDELEEAEGNADLGRADAARAEMDAIAGELAAALGLGGRARPRPDASERARKAVSQRIRNSLKRLAEVHPELAAHLERSIKTGRFCSYSPEGQISWSL